MAEDTHKEGSEEEKKDNSPQDEDFGLPDLEFEELEELDLNMDESETEKVKEEEEETPSEDMLVGSDDIDMSVLDDIEETKPASSSLDQGIDEIEDVLDSAQLISDRLGDEDEVEEKEEVSEIKNTEVEPDSGSIIEESSDEKTIDDFSVEGMSTESVTGLTDEELEALMTPPEPVPDVESIIGGTSESSDDIDDILASIDSPDDLAALGFADEEEPPEVNEEQVVKSSLFAADDNIVSPEPESESSAETKPETNVEDSSVGGSIFESDTSGGSSIFESDSIALEATPSGNENIEFQKPEEARLPSDYKPYTYDEANSGSFAKVIVIGVVIITLIGFGLLYFHKSTGEGDVKKIAKKENSHNPAAKKKTNPVTTKSDKTTEDETASTTPETVVAKKKVPVKKNVVKPTVKSAAPGEIISVTERTGRVYAIIASFIDGDIAMDYAKKLSTEGKGVKIIEPYGKSRNYRVTISDYASVGEATSNLASLKSNYGDGVWALKY